MCGNSHEKSQMFKIYMIYLCVFLKFVVKNLYSKQVTQIPALLMLHIIILISHFFKKKNCEITRISKYFTSKSRANWYFTSGFFKLLQRIFFYFLNLVFTGQKFFFFEFPDFRILKNCSKTHFFKKFTQDFLQLKNLSRFCSF
jgi:hypothetical protein